MKKTQNLCEMSNEELWQLFPIILKKYNWKWKDRYNAESKIITASVGTENIERISHIGSTAVKGLKAKPTIDILLEITEKADLNRIIDRLIQANYIYSPQPDNPPPHMMFLKGYTNKGFKGQAFHLHIRYKGDWEELYFRDYLLAHKDVAKEYGKLKIKLRKKYRFDRDGYTLEKTDFVKKYSQKTGK